MMKALLALVLLRLDVAAPFHLQVVRPHCAARSCAAMCAGGDNEWGFNMDELRHRITSSASAAQLGPAHEVLHNRQVVWVLIFNPGRNDEGVYTLQGRTSPSSSYVLAFDQTDEAQRFAQLLQAEGFDLPQPMEWHADQVRNFCETGQFDLGIVPTGALLTPPTHNEYDDEAYGRLEHDQMLDSPGAVDDARKRLDRMWDM